MTDLELDASAARLVIVRDDDRTNPRLLARLLAEPPGTHERHLDLARRVRACDCSAPDPGDDGRFGSVIERCSRVVLADSSLSFVPHPLPVSAHVSGKSSYGLPAQLLRCEAG